MVFRSKFVQSSILIFILLILSNWACSREGVADPDTIVGKWDISGMFVGIYSYGGSGVNILDTLCEDDGSMRFDSDQDGLFKSKCIPNLIPARFSWAVDDDTLFMDFMGFIIKPLYSIKTEESSAILDLFFSADTTGVIADQDTVLQIRMFRAN
jgi:hypothetical protein